MRTILIAACICCCMVVHSTAQQWDSYTNPHDAAKKDTASISVNQRDKSGKRHGLWWEQFAATHGEAAYTAFGSYDRGMKIGPWYRINELGDLIAIENYRFDVLHGEVKYFEQGSLTCVGHYRGLNPSQAYDTVLVIHPVTGEEKLVGVPSEKGSVRHGVWRFYDAQNGRLIREDDYQIDELLHSKTFGLTTADSAYYRSREKNMPHNRPVHYKPPKGKGSSLTELQNR